MLEQIIYYLGQDRYQSIISNNPLPDRSFGSVLFADISGFTPLTDKLIKNFGPRRGIEQLGIYLNSVYDKLIQQVERFGGSIVSFSGDAITCYFDDQFIAANGLQISSSLRAIATALAMQATMQSFMNLSLTVKTSIATGNVRRFAVGDPRIQLIDTLAGETLQRMAKGEELAEKGEILVDQNTTNAVPLYIAEEREGYSVILGLNQEVSDTRWSAITTQMIDDDLRPWVIPAVFKRLQSGQGEFITELRPCTSLFLHFTGIDYDDDPNAQQKLDALVRLIQNISEKYEATLLALTIGDKGSYLQVGFGLPLIHENDTERAMNAALELKDSINELGFIQTAQIGISQGIVLAGSYGGKTRRTYTMMGNDVNLAARLMQKAEPGQILVSGQAQKLAEEFLWAHLPAINVKGRDEEISVFSLLAHSNEKSFRLHEPISYLPLVGRKKELSAIEEKLALTKAGSGQIVAIVGEAGMGKSRLVAEIVKTAKHKGFLILGGECQSHGTNMPYLVWQGIWRGFFQIDSNNAQEKITEIKDYLSKIDKNLESRLPLLDSVLNIGIPDNNLTKDLDVKLRKESLESLLVDLIKEKAKDNLLLIILEDLHWLDSLSHDLLEVISRVIEHLPIMILLAYRPPELERLQAPRIASLPYSKEYRLNELTFDEARELIGLRLDGIQEVRHNQSNDRLIGMVAEKAQGNPFFIEEIIRYLQDKRFADVKDLDKLELPDSLHTLILSRIDQLTEHEKLTLKIASVIGRVFRFSWLCGYYPALGTLDEVKNDLEELRQLELTPLDTPEPELTYIFKHIVTREVAYESLSYSTRASLHGQLASWLEKNLNIERNLDLLAYHYERGENTEKKKYYLKRAAEAASASYANQIAIDYYNKLLAITDNAKDRADIMAKLAQINEVFGDLSEAERVYRQLLELSQIHEFTKQASHATFRLGSLFRQRSSYEEALSWLNKASLIYSELDDKSGLSQTITELAMLKWHNSQYEEAKLLLNQSYNLARSVGDKKGAAFAISNLGRITYIQGNYERSTVLYQQAMDLSQEINDKRNVALSSKDIAGSLWALGKYDQAWHYVERSLHICQEIGDKQGMSHSYANMGIIAFAMADYDKAYNISLIALQINQELGNKWACLLSLTNLGHIVAEKGEYQIAWRHHYDALILSVEIKEKQGIVYSLIGVADAISALFNDQISLKEAVIILNAAEKLRQQTNFNLEPDEQRQFDRTLNRLKAILGEKFDQLWQESEAAPLEMAVELGLKPRMELWNAESGS